MGDALGFRDASATLGPVERLTRAELEALQLRRLQAQLERLWHTNPFYRAKLEAAGASPDRIRSLDDFNRRVPPSTKADFLADQEAHPPFGRRLGVPRDEVTLVNMTGGTSGQGQEVYGRTDHDIAVQGYLHLLPWFMAGLRPGHMALNCVPTGGLTTGGWGPPEGFRIAGATAFHAGGTLSTDAKIDLMLRFGEMHFIYASTNYLHTLTEALRRRGIVPAERFPTMRAIHIVAEGYPLEWARGIEAFWGCRLHEGYGSTQGAGFIASTCEDGVVRADGGRGLMRLLEWINYVEVVDPETGRHVAPGEEGEIVLTNLDIRGSPVMRFSTRDRARFLPHHACSSGRAWNCLETGTIGRYDDMLKIRGNNVWPLAVDTVVFAEAAVAEYVGRVFVDESGRTRVQIRLALKDGHADLGEAERSGLIGRLGQRIKERTNVQMELQLVPRADLPVFAYKARRWTDERKAGMTG